MPAGRPTKYKKKDWCKLIVEYFDIPPYEIKEREIVRQGKKIIEYYKEPCDLPLFGYFAASNNIDQVTLERWAKDPGKPEFCRAWKKAKKCQERILAVNGMNGSYNTAFAIFTAKNILGWRDKRELEHSGKVETENKVLVQLQKLREQKEINIASEKYIGEGEKSS